MVYFDDQNFSVNNNGNAFYDKWRKDTIISVFVVAPTMIVFYLFCTILIVGITAKLFLISFIPVALILTGLVYAPYFLRKKYINNMVKSISIKNDMISIETYSWFNYRAVSISAKIATINLNESFDVPFFKGRKVFLVRTSNLERRQFYIVNDFFENISPALYKIRGLDADNVNVSSL